MNKRRASAVYRIPFYLMNLPDTSPLLYLKPLQCYFSDEDNK